MKILKNRKGLIVIGIIILAIVLWLFFWPENQELAKQEDLSIPASVKVEDLTTNGDSKVSWDEAINILRSGEVRQIVQRHNLEVAIKMNNGDQITTTEPAIDEVIEELKLCGKICENIIIATE